MCFPTQRWLLFLESKSPTESKSLAPGLYASMVAASTLVRATDPGKQSAGSCKSSSDGLWKRPYLNPELLPSALGGQHVSGTMWLVVSCVVNRNRKVGANSRDPISTSTMQRHRNPNHHI